jgi:SagB-type dehydrogenase family enzyme
VAREPIPLPRDFGLSSARAANVLSGRPLGVVEAPWDAKRLARLLFFSNGVSRTSRSAFGETTYFSTSMSAGNLHPVEIYVVCGDLDGVSAGVHHFAPLEFGLTELRRGDYRGALARAAVDPRVTEAPVTLVVSGIPWRTGWKYAERGFRHLYWDAGTMLANLLELAPGEAHVLTGFVDDEINGVLDIDGEEEAALALLQLR